MQIYVDLDVYYIDLFHLNDIIVQVVQIYFKMII